jgi:valyl-tRNA synthetase
MEFPKKYKADEAESRCQAAWEASQIYAWDPEKSREETFSVDTPPPTVSGSLHVGHMFSYSHQDFIVRYQRMRGKNIFFPIGWDDNGLPTERRVQNLMNVKCEPHLPYDPDFKAEKGKKKEIKPISRANFVELCDEVVAEDEKVFKQLWTKLGMSYDWHQEYATIDEHSRRISQYSFLELLEKGEAYQAESPVMWDVDFQTAIAQAELVDKERPSAYNFLRFGVRDSSDHLVIATTRPELLAACVAVLVHPEDERFKQYIGKEAVTPLFKVPVPIIADEKADPEKGTGVVMCCTFGDQTDVEWWKQYKLPIRQIIGRDGHLLQVSFEDVNGLFGDFPGTRVGFLDARGDMTAPMNFIASLDHESARTAYSQIQGQYTKKAQKIIIALAEEAGDVIDRPAEPIIHAVKFFEKGERPLELVPARQWYTKIMDKKEVLVAQGRKIGWHPEFMGKRYESWVEGLNQDWCLSRQRFFGVPIPVWYGIDAKGEVDYDQRIVPKTEELPIDPLADTPAGFNADQRDQPGGFTGDPDVLDTWATSSLTPQIASKWILDKKRHAKIFPMDIRPQAHEIIRTWAFYTIVKAYLHEGEIPWRHIVLSGWILDPDRKKMSKSQGNVVTPEPLIAQFGADSVRYWAARARLGVDTTYDEQVFKVGKKLVTKLFNASKFAIGRFADVDAAQLTPDKITQEADRAVIAELRPLIERSTKAFDQFDYAQTLSLVEDFFWRTFCDNYLELAKPRTYDEELTVGRLSACATLRLVHRALVRMLAPFIPFITEEVWGWTYTQDGDMHTSIHKSPWPRLDEFSAVPAPQHPETYDAAISVVEAIRRAKADNNLSMAAPIASVRITAGSAIKSALETVADDLQRMLRIESVEILEGEVEEGLTFVEADFGESK